MTFLDELLSILRILNAQRFRTFLTLLGIIIGVGTLVVLSSAIEGSGKYMQRTMQQATGEDVISLSKRWDDEETGKKAQPLDRFDSRALTRSDTLKTAQVLDKYSMRVPWGSRWGQNIWVVGTRPDALAFYALEVDQGRFITPADMGDQSKVVVLGSEARTKLLPGIPDPLGQEVKLKGQRFKVVGVLKKKPKMGSGSFQTWDGSVIVTEPVFVDRFARSKEVREIVVKAPADLMEAFGIGRIAAAVSDIVLWRHHGVQNYSVTDPLKNAQGMRVVQLIVGGLEVAIAGVCLGVGGINVMNIMLVSVTQRTREIGIRRAVGATKANIRRQFLTEAAILSGVGGVLGVVGGTAIAWLLSLALTAAFGYWPFIFVPFQAGLGFVFALLTGLAFGWFPAHKAANLSPIDCLRYE